jgi:hypothetical protein
MSALRQKCRGSRMTILASMCAMTLPAVCYQRQGSMLPTWCIQCPCTCLLPEAEVDAPELLIQALQLDLALAGSDAANQGSHLQVKSESCLCQDLCSFLSIIACLLQAEYVIQQGKYSPVQQPL